MSRIQETSIDHSQTQADVVAKKAKYRWSGEGDKETSANQLMRKPADKNAITEIAMEPQRIRTFVIDYSQLIVNKTTGEVVIKKEKEIGKNATGNISTPVVPKNITGGPFKMKKQIKNVAKQIVKQILDAKKEKKVVTPLLNKSPLVPAVTKPIKKVVSPLQKAKPAQKTNISIEDEIGQEEKVTQAAEDFELVKTD